MGGKPWARLVQAYGSAVGGAVQCGMEWRVVRGARAVRASLSLRGVRVVTKVSRGLVKVKRKASAPASSRKAKG